MKDRVAQILQAEGLSSRKFAEKVGFQPSAISHILAGRNKPGYELIKAIMTSFPAVDPDWLITGQGQMYRQNRAMHGSQPNSWQADGSQVEDLRAQAPIKPEAELDLWGGKDYDQETEAGSDVYLGVKPVPVPGPEMEAVANANSAGTKIDGVGGSVTATASGDAEKAGIGVTGNAQVDGDGSITAATPGFEPAHTLPVKSAENAIESIVVLFKNRKFVLYEPE